MRRSGSVTLVMDPLTWTVHGSGFPVQAHRSPLQREPAGHPGCFPSSFQLVNPVYGPLQGR